MRGDDIAAPDTKEVILEVGLRHFSAHGYAGTSLNDIADEVGIRRPSVLHHFPSKEALYRSVVMNAFSDWYWLVEEATSNVESGWPQVERVLRTAFRFFEERPEAVRLARREALDGGPVLAAEMATVLRPGFAAAREWLQQEMDAGRLRYYDPGQLILTAYGAVLSYLSDAALITALRDVDPLSPTELESRREHVLSILRFALEP
jgi:AcrR family transcriptional regulator